MENKPKRTHREAGFTLIESLVAILVLTILMVGVFSAVNKAQRNYQVENSKVDLTQQQRAFVDQFTRDLRQAGFPTPASQGLPTPPGGFSGITLFPNATDLTMHGDVDGTGDQTIQYVYQPPPCSCLQRIVTRTIAGVASTTVETAVENVVAPNAQEIFTAYDSSGNPVPPGGGALLSTIRSVSITFTVQGGNDLNGSPLQTSMTGMARLPNND